MPTEEEALARRAEVVRPRPPAAGVVCEAADDASVVRERGDDCQRVVRTSRMVVQADLNMCVRVAGVRTR